jgi:hypothetical protein
MIYESRRQPDTDHDHPQSGTTSEVDGDASSPIDHDAIPQADSDAGEPGDGMDALDADGVTEQLPSDAVMPHDEWPDAPSQETPAAAQPAPAEHPEPIWTAEQTAQFQERWQALQLRFVDDPRSAAEQAAALVGEAMDEFSTAVAARRQQLDAWRDNGGSDGEATEQMRIAVRSYHHLLDRLLAS